jgi:hypothetical protein
VHHRVFHYQLKIHQKILLIIIIIQVKICFKPKEKYIFFSIAPKPTKFTYPSHLCVTSNGQLCISFAGSNQLILCEIDGKVIVSSDSIFMYNRNFAFFHRKSLVMVIKVWLMVISNKLNLILLMV